MNESAWAAQTRWLTDQHFVSEHTTIWTERVTRRDRRCEVTDRDIGKRRDTLDLHGNLVPVTAWDAAKVVIERLLDRDDPQRRARITPAAKWQAVELLANKQAKEAMQCLQGH